MKIVESKKAEVVTQAIVELLYPIKKLLHTITSDNGKEFSYHEEISKKLNIDFYFCDPYSSWQLGLNNRHRKILNFHSPKEIFLKEVSRKMVA